MGRAGDRKKIMSEKVLYLSDLLWDTHNGLAGMVKNLNFILRTTEVLILKL